MSQNAGDMVQVHMLTAYPAALLNRDDAGLAKRIPFGGSTRVRISSQCLKKHWREAERIRGLGDQAVRSTRIYEQLVAEPLMEEHGATEQEATAIAQYLMAETVDTKPVKKDGVETARSGQLLVLTRAETDFLAELGADILRRLHEAGVTATTAKDVKEKAPIEDKEIRKMLRERQLPASLDTALFGRMVTSDLFARVDSAVSVAHAFTTHAEEAETDYFTAVDTLKTSDDDAGAGLINDTELTSGVFYTYAVLDMNQLRENLVGHEPEFAERLARNLVETMATVSPGAKRGSTAPFSRAEFVLLERGGEQPRTLANAFLQPVSVNGANVLADSAEKLIEYRHELEEMYGDGDGRAALSTIHLVPTEGLERMPLRRALDSVFRTAE
ncbi:MAG TPA: type I-E CRISPR-associated protein Cas7/Cse4/CasC [Longimicrobiaceae bacterium]|nr:type I-E CRISPR-associated protein Cas7/Cse4/CasC [Longimicrobiaceae bacterium]